MKPSHSIKRIKPEIHHVSFVTIFSVAAGVLRGRVVEPPVFRKVSST